jgi:hypothetical protein
MDKEVALENVFFPEFSATQCGLGPIKAIIHHWYGRDAKVGNRHSQHITDNCLGYLACSFQTPRLLFEWVVHNALAAASASADFDEPDDPLDDLGYKLKTIKNSLYEKHDPIVFAEQQTYLSPSQRQDLADVLK